MPSNPTPTTRRRFLASFLSLAAAPAEGFSLFGKKRARDLGKVYDYLQDVSLRIKETGSQRITIKNVIFSGEKFNDEWGNFDFVDCEFAGQYSIRLKWLVKCTFTNCTFKEYVILEHARDVRFINCTVATDGLGGVLFHSNSTGLVLESCTFRNSGYDPSYEGGVISKGEVSFIDCKAEGAFVLESYKKMTLLRCTTRSTTLATASAGLFSDKNKMPYADFLLEDCDFTRGVYTTNLKLNNFTMRNCKLGFFETVGSTARGDVLVENIKQGHLDLSASDFQGKLAVKNCSFYTTVDGHSFRCNTDIPLHSLIENVQCGQAPADIISSYKPLKESDWLPVASNQSTIIRNCDIPHLHVDWAQTEHLRLENCKCDALLIRNGRIGKLEIIDCTLKKLDVSNTQVQEQDVRVPAGCDTLSAGSNLKWSPAE